MSVAANAESIIKDIRTTSTGVNAVFTERAAYFTYDQGGTWDEATLSLGISESINDLQFAPNDVAYVLLTSRLVPGVSLAVSFDNGRIWHRMPVNIPADALAAADLSNCKISIDGDLLRLIIRLESSSNIALSSVYRSADRGNTWIYDGIVESTSDNGPNISDAEKQLFAKLLKLDTNENIVMITGRRATGPNQTLFLAQAGTCFGYKSACFQMTRLILADGSDVTPPQVRESARLDREAAIRENEASRTSVLPPGGTTRISLNRGFDKCQAGSVAQMQLWWDNSPLYDTNIYFSGRNRACASQPLNTSWINQVTAMGWGLIPTVVGYQSPCTAGTTTVKLSYDPAIAETQGRGEADIAVSDAANIGLTAGSILYYDMERYDPPTPDTLGCRTATVAFLKGWTERIRELGYKSGVYGSPKNAQEDWALFPAASKMDAIWMARWDNNPSVWAYLSFPTFPTAEWADHQRIKQWQAPHNETWGGVTFNIDGNNADGPVAGLAIARNKDADFDGDGRSDVSVFRPENGLWYVQFSTNSAVGAVQFGVTTDSIMPRDYDGDGKTDYGVFRSADGVWYTLTKAGVFSARQFGLPGDLPAAADFNGDGKADIAVFRPSNGYWYIANSDSNSTFTFTNFGLNGDLPVPGDYDGDGKAEIAVFRPSNGVWYIQRSSAGGFAIQFGNSTDILAPADYDGDGKMDVGIYRPSQGTWYSYNSSNGSYPVTVFGLSSDLPVPGDYDGDGKADIAIFRPSNGQWWLNRTTSGLTVVQFGLDGDRPVPNALRN